MVEQGGELHLLVLPCCFPHARQPLGHALPALSRVRVRLTSVLLDRRPSLLTLRRRVFRLCSNDSSVLYRRVTPRGRTCGPCGLSLRPPTCRLVWPAGVSEVSRFSCMKFLGVPWGLRLRRTEQELALSLLPMLPSAHFNRVGVRVVCFRSSIPTPPILYLRFAGSLAVAAQDSRPSGSLLLSCEDSSILWSGRGLARCSEGSAYLLLPVSSGSASLAKP